MAVLVQGHVRDRPWGQTLGALGLRGLTGQLVLHADDKDYGIAFENGTVIGAWSPNTADSAPRIALTSHLVSSTAVPAIQRRILAMPDRDEVEVVAEIARLSPEQTAVLRTKVVGQRAARTFAIDAGEFTVDDQITIPCMPPPGLDVRAVVYLGARLNLSEERLAKGLRTYGTYFQLKPEAQPLLDRYGFSDAERTVLVELAAGTSLHELEAAHRELDPRMVQAIVYALFSCQACEVSEAPAMPRAATVQKVRPSPTSPPPLGEAAAYHVPASEHDVSPRTISSNRAPLREPLDLELEPELATPAPPPEPARTITNDPSPLRPPTPPVTGRTPAFQRPGTESPFPPRTPTPPIASRTPTPGFEKRSPTPPLEPRTPTPGFDNRSPRPPLEPRSPTPGFEKRSPTPPLESRTPTPGFEQRSPTPPLEPRTPTPGFEKRSPTPPPIASRTPTPGFEKRSPTPPLEPRTPTPGFEKRSPTPPITGRVSTENPFPVRSPTPPITGRVSTENPFPVRSPTPPITGRVSTENPFPVRSPTPPFEARTQTDNPFPVRQPTPPVTGRTPSSRGPVNGPDEAGVPRSRSGSVPPSNAPASSRPATESGRPPTDAPAARFRPGGAPRAPTEQPAPAVARTSTGDPPAVARTNTGAPPAVARTSTGAPPAVARTATSRKTAALIAARVILLDQGADHFALLGVPFDAPADVVRTAYLALVRQLHPDKLVELSIDDTSGDATRLFAALGNAFTVLTDAQKRAQYRASLGAPGAARTKTGEDLATTPAVEAYRRGEAALRRDEPHEAVEHFTRAVELSPQDADYAAMLGWARFCAAPDKVKAAPDTRRVLERAIKSSPKPYNARFLLGRVERMLGRDKEALRVFETVLEDKPSHAEARAEIRAIEIRLGGSGSRRR